MDFKKINIDDKPVLQPYLLKNPYGICDYSFANLFIWQETYRTQYCIHKDHLIIRTLNSQGEPAFLMPLGEGDKKEIITDMIEETAKLGKPFRLVSVTSKMEKELQEIISEDFVVSNPNDFCDYIYLSESLRFLKGKKLSAKRNHINKFMSLYVDLYKYVEIDESNLSLCREMNVRWCQERNCNKTDSDFCAVEKALDHWGKLGLQGGALLVDGEMIAFTMGQPNNDDTFNVMIEKALTHVEGAYAMINREFAVRNCENYLLVNREEDMGVEGLKKSKLSYQPYLLLKKGMGVLR